MKAGRAVGMAGLAALIVIQGFLPSGPGGARAAGPDLPDLSVSPEDIIFTYYGDPLDDLAFTGFIIGVDVTVRNAGLGNSSSANVTVFIDGLYFATMHLMENLTAGYPGNKSTVHLTWDTGSASVGNHTVRVEVNDTAGDADLADNAAERSIRLIGSLPHLDLRLDPTISEAVVSPTAAGTVEYVGSAHVDLGEWAQALVYLSVRVDYGFEVHIEPQVMEFVDSGSQAFNVTAVVPAANPAGAVGAITVEGLLVSDIISINAQVSVIVKTRPYYRFSIEACETAKEVAPGEAVAFAVQVHNTGNSIDSYGLEVANQEELSNAGIDVALEMSNMPKLGFGHSRNVTVTAIVHTDWAPYRSSSSDIKLYVFSLNADDVGTNVSTTTKLTVTIRGFYMPSVLGLLIVALVPVAAISGAVYRRRRKRKPQKTLKDYMVELNLEKGG